MSEELHPHEAAPNTLPVPHSPEVLTPIPMPEEHQRFYDKLRARIEAYIREKGMSDTAVRYLLLAPDLFVLLSRLMMDKRVPVRSKGILGLAIAYFLTPLDVLPELITGAFGYLDDVVLAVFALRKILVDVDRRILYEHWNGEDDLLDVITRVVEKADQLVGKRVRSKLDGILFGRKR